MLEILQAEFHDAIQRSVQNVPRDIKLPAAKNVIKVAIGMRRVGKTQLLYQAVRDLLTAGVPLERILFINFEDDRLLPMDQQAMGALLDQFYELYPENRQQECYFFLDEVQNVDGWQRVVRRFFDTRPVQIYLSGSSAKLLSKEIATSLRGRSLAVEVWPYDFPEYRAAHGIELPTVWSKSAHDQLALAGRSFLASGGFPAVQHLEERERLDLLQEYVHTAIFRDVVERYNVANIPLLKYLMSTLLKNVAKPFSFNKFHSDIRSQGYQVSKATLYKYLQYLEDAYLIFAIPTFSESMRGKQTSIKKIYAIDGGLVRASTFNLSDNFGKWLENQVYLDFRRQRREIFYYRTQQGYEIDFVTVSRDGFREMVQVVWDTSDAEALAREERALEAAQAELGVTGRLLDFDAYLRHGVDAVS